MSRIFAESPADELCGKYKMYRVVEVKEREEESAPPRAAQHREEGGII
jgi:hypothetical protein